jgi:hypothetical protein
MYKVSWTSDVGELAIMATRKQAKEDMCIAIYIYIYYYITINKNTKINIIFAINCPPLSH